MNNKHIACVIVLIMLLGLLQVTSWMNGRMVKMQDEAARASQAADVASIQLMGEQRQLQELKRSSKNLIDFLNTWQPYFAQTDSSQNAELRISLRIKQDNLVNLSQRYEVTATKNNKSLPYIMRAHLSFEDNYARLLNWFGQLETELPTLRIASIKIAPGTGENDLKIDAILEQPISGTR